MFKYSPKMTNKDTAILVRLEIADKKWLGFFAKEFFIKDGIFEIHAMNDHIFFASPNNCVIEALRLADANEENCMSFIGDDDKTQQQLVILKKQPQQDSTNDSKKSS